MKTFGNERDSHAQSRKQQTIFASQYMYVQTVLGQKGRSDYCECDAGSG